MSSTLPMAFRRQLFILFMVMTGWLLQFNAPASAYSFAETYMAPEVMYADDLAQRVSIRQMVNLNQASFNELMTLPGLDENLALKLMRIRPIENIRDFYKMPWVDANEIQRLIQRLQGRVAF